VSPIPSHFSLDHLIGRTLTAVSFGPFDLHFLFAPKDDILCVGTVIVEIDAQSVMVMHRGVRQELGALNSLPGRSVINWGVDGPHEFSVILTGGAKLRFISSDSSGENFVIFPGVQVV
jgi:hypothetical protein